MKTKTLLLAMLTIWSVNANSQIINVPGDFTTIQEGINVAVDGDTVLIADGLYYENINFKGKAITVASHCLIDADTNHISNTIIDGSQPVHADSASVVMFVSGEDTTSILFGLTLKNGTGTNTTYYGSAARLGGGVCCYLSGAKLVKNRILDNNITHETFALGAGVGSIADSQETWLVLEDNAITNNISEATGSPPGWRSAAGGGMFAHSNTRANNNIIQYNECYSLMAADGPGMEFESGDTEDLQWMVYITNNNIQFNTADGNEYAFGGGISNNFTKMHVRYNIISNNTLISDNLCFGAGFFLTGYQGWGDEVIISNNEFVNNKAIGMVEAWGSAMHFDNPDNKIEVRNNLISQNDATLSTEANGTVQIWFSSGNTVGKNLEIIVDGNYFMNNASKKGGAINAYNSFNFSITNNLFLSNNAQYGGAIYLRPPADKKSGSQLSDKEETKSYIANNTFVHNQASLNGGAISNQYVTETVAAFNNIYWLNSASVGNDIFITNNQPNLVAYSNIDEDNIEGSWTGNNNFDQNPEISEDSLHITGGSPCLNTGIDEIEFDGFTFYSPINDIDGEARPMNNLVDVGADEYLAVGVDLLLVESDNLLTVYPNPCSSNTTIEYTLPGPGFVSLKIFDITGNLVETLFSGNQAAGLNKIEWRPDDLHAGQYFIQIITNDHSFVQKVQKLK